MQEESRPTNLIYFHTDLMLALDQIGHHLTAPVFCPLPCTLLYGKGYFLCMHPLLNVRDFTVWQIRIGLGAVP